MTSGDAMKEKPPNSTGHGHRQIKAFFENEGNFNCLRYDLKLTTVMVYDQYGTGLRIPFSLLRRRVFEDSLSIAEISVIALIRHAVKFCQIIVCQYFA
jgi:hypothetical protein